MTLDQWEAFFPPKASNEGVPEWTEEQLDEIEFLKRLRLRALPEIEEEPEWSEETYEYVASCVLNPKFQGECQGVVGASNPLLSPEIEVVKQRLLDKYATSVFTPHLHRNCPSRGPNCEATIHLIPGVVPVKHRIYK